jgi:hypothetical protein
LLQILEWEFQGKHFNEQMDAKIAKGDSYYLGLEQTAGFKIVSTLIVCTSAHYVHRGDEMAEKRKHL